MLRTAWVVPVSCPASNLAHYSLPPRQEFLGDTWRRVRRAVSRLQAQDQQQHNTSWFALSPRECCLLIPSPRAFEGAQPAGPPAWAGRAGSLHQAWIKTEFQEIKELWRLKPKCWIHTCNSLPAEALPSFAPLSLQDQAPFSTTRWEVKGEEECGTLTTSVFVILARRSVRLSPSSSWRPQMAAPTLPVAIIDGGYMAKLKSARTDLGISPSPDQKSCKTSEASNIKKTTPKNKTRGSRRKGKVPLFLVPWSSLVTLLITSSQRRGNRPAN